jgi:hypothetical protein
MTGAGTPQMKIQFIGALELTENTREKQLEPELLPLE